MDFTFIIKTVKQNNKARATEQAIKNINFKIQQFRIPRNKNLFLLQKIK
jgi:hypothetical protein